ncbi:MAG: hypothetical protein KAH10_05140 [Flavobacteriales bacterium]|nr:hypothetical protein [Flavobacteriales bacterium]
MKIFRIPVFLIFLVTLTFSCIPRSDSYNDGPSNLEVSSFFSDGIVLQQGTEISVWGKAYRATKVEVDLDGSSVSVVTNKMGDWKVKLPSQKAGGPFELKVSANDTVIVFNKVFIKPDVNRKSIISVIENQTKAHLAKDYKGESNTFVQDESTIILISRQNWYGYVVGWDKLSQSIKVNITKDPEPSTETFKNTDYKIKIYDRSAWVVYNENSFNAKGNLIRKVINVRFLEINNGVWKIVYLSDVDITSYE